MTEVHLLIEQLPFSKNMNGCFLCFVPQGQMEASAMLEASAPEDAEFYVVIRGSTLTHITTAKRGVDGLTLRFTAPGTLTPGSICILSFPLSVALFAILSFPASHRPRSRWSRRRHILLLHGGAGPGLSGGSVCGAPQGQGAALPSEPPRIPEEIVHADSRRGARRWRGGRAAGCWSCSRGSGGAAHRRCGQPGIPSALEKHRQSSKRGR